MELNKESAMRLWNRAYGKETSCLDYAGRKIVKGAYNDRNSEFAWNVDHIYPQSKGGKTNDSNLIICHILTNDEKADKFPCFTANKQKFEILKVQNHYEIKSLSNHKNEQQRNDEVDFLDSASGLRLFKKLEMKQDKPRFVGSVFIKLENLKNTAIIDFVEHLFDSENISFNVKKDYYSTITTILLKNYDMPYKEQINELLDKCVALNTYMSYYFRELGLVSNYEIIFRVDNFKEKSEMYIEDKKINDEIINPRRLFIDISNCTNSLYINDLVVINTDANEKIKCDNNEYYEYNIVYTNLENNLKKEASRR